MQLFKNYRIWLIMSVTMAVLAGIVAVSAVRSYVDTVKVVATTREVDSGQIVDAGFLTMVDVPRGNLYPDAVYNAGEIAGMVARGYIPAGTVLRRSMFMPLAAAGTAGQLSVMSENTGEKYLAVAVPNSLHTTVAGVLQSGNRVDIYTQARGENPSPELLASNVQVIQAGFTRDGQQRTEGVVIAVRQQELSRILPYLFGGRGELVFVLRPVEVVEREIPTENRIPVATEIPTVTENNVVTENINEVPTEVPMNEESVTENINEVPTEVPMNEEWRG